MTFNGSTIPAASWPCVVDAAERYRQDFLDAHPNVQFAEYGHFGPFKNARVIIVVDGDEWEGRGTTLNSALADAHVKASGGYDVGLPGNGGFAYRASTGEFVEWGN